MTVLSQEAEVEVASMISTLDEAIEFHGRILASFEEHNNSPEKSDEQIEP
jgi:hypothetical protein